MKEDNKRNNHTGKKADELRKRVVLIADDDNTSRRILTHYVQKMGYTAVSAEDGEECIQSISEQTFDVILLDINMPKKDGFEVMLHLKAHNISTSVIMVTASNDIPQAVKCIKLGAYEYLTKPLDVERLEIVMRNALAESTLKNQVQQLKKELKNKELFQSIIGESTALKETMEQVRQVMNTDLNVLILGESGTGKELFAQAIITEAYGRMAPLFQSTVLRFQTIWQTVCFSVMSKAHSPVQTKIISAFLNKPTMAPFFLMK